MEFRPPKALFRKAMLLEVKTFEGAMPIIL